MVVRVEVVACFQEKKEEEKKVSFLLLLKTRKKKKERKKVKKLSRLLTVPVQHVVLHGQRVPRQVRRRVPHRVPLVPE